MTPQFIRHTIIVAIALFAAAVLPSACAVAATNPTAEIILRTHAAAGQSLAATPTSYLQNFYLWMLGFVGLGALFAFVYGGILYITSGAVDSTAEARKWIWNGLFGIIIAAASYVLLYTINPNLVGGFSIESIIQRHEPPPLSTPNTVTSPTNPQGPETTGGGPGLQFAPGRTSVSVSEATFIHGESDILGRIDRFRESCSSTGGVVQMRVLTGSAGNSTTVTCVRN